MAQIGEFDNIGFERPFAGGSEGGLGALIDTIPFVTVFSASKAAVDFGDDGVLSPGDPTSVTQTFLLGTPFGFEELTITYTGEYIGTDSDGSVHFNFDELDIDGFDVPEIIEEILNGISDFRATNADPFPAAVFPDANPIDLPICFAAGTLIATPDGEKVVEDLRIGDRVLTATGRDVAVKWIGLQVVHKRFTPKEQFSPVKILTGALGEALPHTDLVVTPDHGVMVGDIMVNAGALVNGTSVIRVPASELDDKVTYYHVETEEHDVIVANGAPAETFVDNETRRKFSNYAEYRDLYGDESREMTELPYARAMSRRQLPAHVREHLDERAVAIGAAVDQVAA